MDVQQEHAFILVSPFPCVQRIYNGSHNLKRVTNCSKACRLSFSKLSDKDPNKDMSTKLLKTKRKKSDVEIKANRQTLEVFLIHFKGQKQSIFFMNNNTDLLVDLLVFIDFLAYNNFHF